jgi:dTDP-L-rhamnose 4-epimerase
MSTENVLVTGGAGFIGGHLVEGLLERGHHVRVLDNLEPQTHGPEAERPPFLPTEVDFRFGSVLDREAVDSALSGIDVVFHEAAVVGVGQSMYDIARYCEVNTVGTAVLLEAIVERRDAVRKMIVASSMSVYGEGAYVGKDGSKRRGTRTRDQLAAGDWEIRDAHTGEPLEPVPTSEDKPLEPSSVYAITKRDHEELFLSVGDAYQIPAVALRYFNTYGTRQALSNPYTGVVAIFASRALAGNRPVLFEDGAQRRDFVHVADIVQANLLAMANSSADYQVMNVGSGSPVSVREVASSVLLHMGREDLAPELAGSFRAGDIRHCWADITKARELLGYEPQVRFTDGLADVVAWAAEQSAVDGFEEARRELAVRGLGA